MDVDEDEVGTSGDLAVADEDVAYDRVVVLNPVSGDSSHREQVRSLAVEHGFTVLETEEAGDGIDLAKRAVDGDADFVAAAGGDGTINEVVRGLDEADALDAVTFGVVPTGTGNNFAGNVGVTGIEHAFDVLESGERRRIDLGTANGRVFANSCIGGVTADASHQTDAKQKDRFGVFAYVVNTVQVMTDYEGLPLSIETSTDGEVSWSGDAAFVLVGNGRRFPVRGREQANMEDGLLDVTVIEQMPAPGLVGEATLQRLFGRDSDTVTRMKVPKIDIDIEANEPVEFSLDGEMGEWDHLTLAVEPTVLELCVGPDYEPVPDE